METVDAEDDKRKYAPPDGGTRAWLVLMGSFFCNGIIFGVINSYGVIYREIQNNLHNAGVSEASSKAALVGSLTIGTTFAVSPIAGILADKIGLRMTTFVGGSVAALGMLVSSFLTDYVEALYLTYGVMYGFGAALTYTPSLAVLGHYFNKYLGLANGIVTAGSSIFTIIMPFVLGALINACGLEGTLVALAVLAACIVPCASLFNNPKPKSLDMNTRKECKKDKLFNRDIWKNKRYVIWALVIALALFGYFVPYVHITKFVEVTFLERNTGETVFINNTHATFFNSTEVHERDSDKSLVNNDNESMYNDNLVVLPVVCIGITSGLGRLVFGYIADLPRVDRILLQQISFLCIGFLTMLLPFCGSFAWLLVISLAMGFFDGCFISVLGPIAFDICGRDGAAQAIGFLLGLCSLPLTIGPPLAGLLYEHTNNSYQLPFLLAGVPPILGAAAMFLIRCVKCPEDRDLQASPPETVRLNDDNGIVKLASLETLDAD